MIIVPRPVRVTCKGGIYHVTVRGNRREEMFKENADYKEYLKTMDENLIFYNYDNYEVLAYCLMTNHVHLIIKIENEPLAKFMQRFNSTYAKYFNKKYEYVGHLFEKRYYCKLIESTEQLIETSVYIHLNPVRAKIVEDARDYKWSSCLFYIETQQNKFINKDLILNILNINTKKAFEVYSRCLTPQNME